MHFRGLTPKCLLHSRWDPDMGLFPTRVDGGRSGGVEEDVDVGRGCGGVGLLHVLTPF